MKYVFAVFLFFALLLTEAAFAQRRSKSSPASGGSRITYDLSGGSGSYNGEAYSEITLGLNWYIYDWFNWRNAVFSRSGAGESVAGLDSSARLQSSIKNDDGSFGVDGFVGPGVRLASKDNHAVFGEAGLVFTLGGLRLGAGVKALTYIANREIAGVALPKNDTQVFLILAGGGTL